MEAHLSSDILAVDTLLPGNHCVFVLQMQCRVNSKTVVQHLSGRTLNCAWSYTEGQWTSLIPDYLHLDKNKRNFKLFIYNNKRWSGIGQLILEYTKYYLKPERAIAKDSMPYMHTTNRWLGTSHRIQEYESLNYDNSFKSAWGYVRVWWDFISSQMGN